MIRIENLSRRWKSFSLKNISFEVKEGEYFVILGPTGSGKTLLLETIAGFHISDEGKIIIEGRDMTNLKPNERKIGFVYQDYMLFPNMNVRENIGYGLRISGMDEASINKRVEELAEMLSISHILHRYPSNLSGGEKQRVAIARALAIKPAVLLLDEPLSSLDEMLRERVIRDLKRINRNEGMTVIHVTHSRQEAILLADRIAVINHGEILQIGKPEDIFRKPKNRFIAEFVGVENLFKGVARKVNNITLFETGNVKMYSSMHIYGDVYASIRPEDIIISLKKVESSARNCIYGTIKEMVDMGNVVRITVDCGVPFMVNITHESMRDMNLEPGKKVWLLFKAQNVNLFR
ncbi:MAG: ABC transporter ATP-binding protein [Thermoplasmata archaeon]|nr:ABC transporter ATP-binding protein [Thermoplasmata archaeon]